MRGVGQVLSEVLPNRRCRNPYSPRREAGTPVIMQVQAGIVMGGSALRSGPQVPWRMSSAKVGNCSR
jgi:hypothetical protein